MNVADGQQTLDLLNGSNLVNQVGYVNRFNEVFCEVKKLISDGIIGEVKNFSSEMYGPTVLKDSKSTWRGKKHAGGGCMYEFASHCIDLAVYLIEKPDKVCGSILQNVYSSGVDDLVMTNFLYRNGITGNIIVNWSDETYRKPTNIIKVFGKEGKIVADKHMYKLFLKKDQKENGFRKGWNTRYITDFGKSVRVYVRGNEFTRQLDYFIECIEKGDFENISSFSEAHKTDIIMEQIRHDYLNSINYEESPSKNENTISKEERKLTFWNRIFRNKFRSGKRSLN
jgi:predicted dehydrogenase